MRAKVLVYKNEFNGELKSSKKELEALEQEGVYRCKDEDSLPELVYEIENVFFSVGYFNAFRYQNDPQFKENVHSNHKNFKDVVNEKEKPSKLFIEVFRILGWDYTTLQDKREDYDKKQAEIERQKKLTEAENKRKADILLKWQKRQQKKEILKKVKENEFISFTEFSDIISILNMDVHIRTKGTINKLSEQSLNKIKRDEIYCPKISQSTVNSLLSVYGKMTLTLEKLNQL